MNLDVERSVIVSLREASFDLMATFTLQPKWSYSLMGVTGVRRLSASYLTRTPSKEESVFVPWENVLSLKQDVVEPKQETIT